MGEEDIAFHETDSVNSSSGRPNPADCSYLQEFGMNEKVDISNTKFQDPPIDNTIYSLVQPEKDQLYVGWTKPGEWTIYAINVLEDGSYTAGLMYTSNKNGVISIAVNDKDVTGSISIPTTFVAVDIVAWRQCHHGNYSDNIATIDLKKCLQTKHCIHRKPAI